MKIPVYNEQNARQAIRHLKKSDPVLRQLIQRVGPPRLRLQRGKFESLARSIIAQQISTAAARSIWKRLRQTVAPSRITPTRLANVDDQMLRSIGISPQKLSYLRDLQKHFLDGRIQTRRMHAKRDEQIIEELTQVKGIGNWTAHMFLIFSLGRLDVLPHGDLGIRNAIKTLYGLHEQPDRTACEQIAQPWRPYASLACWYCWRSLEINNKKPSSD